MSTRRVFSSTCAAEQSNKEDLSPRAGLKRKLSYFHSSGREGQICYPSPPMSRRSSPAPVTQLPRSTTNESTALASTTSPHPVQTTAADLTIPSPLFHRLGSPAPLGQYTPYLTAIPTQPAADSFLTGSNTSSHPGSGIWSRDINPSSAEPTFSSSATVPIQSLPRSGRKVKAHVASACINCKRAHLSCDVQRPCARCLASGKQDSCYDVQHKKRGRPRLREQAAFEVEQFVTGQTPGVVSPAPAAASVRPIAAPRRRAESFGSPDPEISESPHKAARNIIPGLDNHRPQPSVALTPSEVPTAFLDVDLVCLRANQPFMQVMNDGRDIQGRHISEIATAADSYSFHAIRNQLRAERDTREPAYMPPIIQPGQDPVESVTEGDIESLTSGSIEQSYTWTRIHTSPGAETFPVRVRLAKAAIYFVVVTLPSFRPVAAPAPPQVSGTRFSLSSQPYSSAYPPPPPSRPNQATLPSFDHSEQPYLATAQGYAPSQSSPSYQRPFLSPTARPAAEELHAERTRLPPLESSRPNTSSSAASTQLPSVTVGANSAGGSSGTRVKEATAPPLEEDDDEPSPKRRRLGIDDVIER